MINETFLAIQKNIEHQDRPGQALHIRSMLEKAPEPDMTASELAVYYSERAGNLRYGGADVSGLTTRMVTRSFFKLPDLEVSGIIEAERAFLREVAKRQPVTQFDAGRSDPSLPAVINRAANLVAARTRRGIGDTVLVGDGGWDLIGEILFNAGTVWEPDNSLASHTAAGTRFRRQGRINNTLDVYTTPLVPAYGIVVVMSGDFADGGGVYVEHDGKCFLSLNRQPEDYASIIHVVWPQALVWE